MMIPGRQQVHVAAAQSLRGEAKTEADLEAARHMIQPHLVI
jgi:hypothetical protein